MSAVGLVTLFTSRNVQGISKGKLSYDNNLFMLFYNKRLDISWNLLRIGMIIGAYHTWTQTSKLFNWELDQL